MVGNRHTCSFEIAKDIGLMLCLTTVVSLGVREGEKDEALGKRWMSLSRAYAFKEGREGGGKYLGNGGWI